MRHDSVGATIAIMSRSLKMRYAASVPDPVANATAARFPTYKDLTGFDLAFSEIREALVLQPHHGEFVHAAEDMMLIGGPGTAKSHVATDLGIQLTEHRYQHERQRTGQRCGQGMRR
ncbi:ATP-binding protein [Pseudorhodobacter aquimaris]|uniref:ATP-binding protein n=1 Tax=Pseudorhodobacter aquimaris TaxID=687412 RepID=UPI00067B76CE|nr:ATP-binding protein [Pseudorhodobacter aquimaris]